MKAFSQLVLLASALAAANDGWYPLHGSPGPFRSHPSIQMVSEKITVTIHDWHADVDCRFVFKNHGAPTTVRMGFPDDHSNREKGDQAKSIYTSFRSYVNGRRVQTRLEPRVVPAGEVPRVFQVKDVSLPKAAIIQVRDTYRVPLGSFALRSGEKQYPAIKTFDYIFTTGATWRGHIEKCEMVITFAPDATMPKGSIRLIASSDEDKAWTYPVWRKQRNAVAVSHPKWFVVRGRQLRLVKKNWRPGPDAVVQLTFGPHFRRP